MPVQLARVFPPQFSFLFPWFVSVAVLWSTDACLDVDHIPVPEGVGELHRRGCSNLTLRNCSRNTTLTMGFCIPPPPNNSQSIHH